MEWNSITSEAVLDDIDAMSTQSVQIIFKHSTRCSISNMALGRFERNFQNQNVAKNAFLLDLLQHRSVSNAIAERYAVQHQSPQLLVIKDKKCIYSATHNEIDVATMANSIA